VLEPVETSGMTLEDVPALKAQVRELIVRTRDALADRNLHKPSHG
jgi:hypothetical protein